jgi:serine/threonine protein kinase
MKLPATLKWKSTGKTLGEGGQGTVIEVVEQGAEGGATFALKALARGKPAKAYERFAREIQAIKNLNHPAIIKIIDRSEHPSDFHYYVMELIPTAISLKKLVGSNQNHFHRDPLKSLQLFIQLLEVIKACEEIKIVHRDLSLANILLLPDNSIKVIDFGICQLEEAETITLTDEGVGTPNYMAPECESGAGGGAAAASDMYSAGKILWSLIANMNAFSRENPVFNSKSMNAIFPDLPSTWHLHHIFEKTVRHNPVNRWQKVEDALRMSRRVHFLVASGYLPLESIANTCPICGFGYLDSFDGSHVVFGNPNPRGIVSSQCSYCGFCFAINSAKIENTLKSRKQLE